MVTNAMTKNFLKALTLSSAFLSPISAMDSDKTEKTNTCEAGSTAIYNAVLEAVDRNDFETINNIFAGTHTRNQPLLGKNTANFILGSAKNKAITNGNLALLSLLTIPADLRISQCVARYILHTIVPGLNNDEFSVSEALNIINSHLRNRADGIILTGICYDPDIRFLGEVLDGLDGLDEATINKEFLLNLFRPTPLFRLNSMPQV